MLRTFSLKKINTLLSTSRLLSSQRVFFSSENVVEKKIKAEDSNTTTNNLGKIKQILQEGLNRENYNYYPIDEEQLKTVLSINNFSFINEENSKIVKLEKKVDEDKSLKLIITPKQPDFDTDKEEARINTFYLIVKSSSKKSGLLFEAATINEKIYITQVNYSEDINSLENKTFSLGQNDGKTNILYEEYKGPHFYTLDKNLQESFIELLSDEYGISNDIISVINVLSVEKDQELYLSWLKNLNKLI